MGQGLREIAKRKRLLLVLDTYEIVDVADIWLRLVMKAAGPRLIWILSGRNDLARSRPFGKSYLLGYESEFGTHLLAYDLPELALADVRAYFADRVPERPLDDETAPVISQATRGIPLVVVEAAEMWAKGRSLAEIAGDSGQAVPAHQIVAQMTARYLLHVVAEEDRQALYALALA